MAQIHLEHFLENRADHLLIDGHDLRFRGKRHFHINLGKFRLAVRPEIFVTETFCDLVITVHARHHQQLLEQLWRLRQRKKLAFVGAARHQVIAGALRRGPGQDRGFNIQKSPLIEKVANNIGHPGAEPHIAEHFRPAQVQIAVLEPHFLAYLVMLIQRERRRFGCIQYLHSQTINFNLAGGHFRVDGFGGSGANPTSHLQHIFTANPVGEGKMLAAIRIKHDLHDTFTIAQIDKDHTPVVASTIHPTAQGDFLINVFGAEHTTITCPHYVFPLLIDGGRAGLPVVLVQAAGVEPAASLGFASGFALLSKGWSPAIFFLFSFLKSVSYQPLPLSRKPAAVNCFFNSD